MKNAKLIFLILLCFFCGLNAQDFRYNVLGSIDFKTVSFRNQNGLMLGAKFGWEINKAIVIGASYHSLVTNRNLNTLYINSKLTLEQLNYGGLEIEYYPFAKGNLIPSVSLFVGGGGVSFTDPEKPLDKRNLLTLNLLLYEPGINLKYKILNWLSVSSGVSFQMFTNLNGDYGLHNKDFGGITGNFSIRFEK